MSRSRIAFGWLIPTAILLSFFGLIVWDLQAEGALYRLDHAWAESLFNFGCSRTDLHNAITFITDLGTSRILIIVGCANTVLFILKREWQAAIIFGGGQWLLFRFVAYTKLLFERQRPPFLGWTDLSFPSGHATGSSVVYGVSMLAILCILNNRKWAWFVVGSLLTLILAIAASRPLYGAHYISDVLAGICLGFGYVCFLASLGNRKSLRPPKTEPINANG